MKVVAQLYHIFCIFHSNGIPKVYEIEQNKTYIVTAVFPDSNSIQVRHDSWPLGVFSPRLPERRFKALLEGFILDENC